MTRKDFVLLAQALKNSAPGAGILDSARHLQYARTCAFVADILATTNPRFDRARFLTACGVTS